MPDFNDFINSKIVNPSQPQAGQFLIVKNLSGSFLFIPIGDIATDLAVVNATEITTNNEAAQLDLTGTTVGVSGTDNNINITYNTKGTGAHYFSVNSVGVLNVNSAGITPNADNTKDVGTITEAFHEVFASNQYILKGLASAGYGTFNIRYKAERKTFTGGASETIETNVPAGAKIILTLLRVDKAVVFGGGGTTWAAAYTGGSSQSIIAVQNPAKNTKARAFYDSNVDSDIATAVTNIVITPDSGTLDDGIISAVTYYFDAVNLTSV